MSWCRWSSMEHACDLYVYESDEGVEVNIAGRRPLIDRSTLPPDGEFLSQAWFARRRALLAPRLANDYEVIDLPHAGEWRVFDTLPGAADFIDELESLGYVVPPGMTADMRAEADQ